MIAADQPVPATYIKAAQPIRISMLCEKSGRPPSDYHEMLRLQESLGQITILSMDDEWALICWHDQRMARALQVRYARRVAS